MAAHKMVVVNGVRYREEDAPKRAAKVSDEPEQAVEADAQHKMRKPAAKAARKSSKS